MSKQETEELIKRLEAFSVPEDGADRQRLWEATRSFLTKIEDEVTLQHRLLSSPLQLVIPRIASDLGIFEILQKSEQPVSTDDIAAQTKADGILLDRILRYLASQFMITSPNPQQWAPSKLTPFLANPAYASGLRFGSLCVLPSAGAFSEVLSSNSYKDTSPANPTAFQRAHSISEPMFKYLAGRPGDFGDFQKWMAESRKRDLSPFDMLPMEQLTKSASKEAAAFVDVGGGNGSICIDLKKRLPSIEGGVINQDIQATDLDLAQAGVEHQTQDCFEEQPIKGAKIYQLRKMLRIFSDDKCVALLRRLRDAMDKDSIILVDDVAIDTKHLSWHTCYVDLVMGMFFGTRERTLPEFEKIFAEAGLAVQEAKQYMASGEHYILLKRQD